jgi:hypothetical protein
LTNRSRHLAGIARSQYQMLYILRVYSHFLISLSENKDPSQAMVSQLINLSPQTKIFLIML